MSENRGPILVCAVIAIGFVAGYAYEGIEDTWENLSSKTSEIFDAQQPAEIQPSPTPVRPIAARALSAPVPTRLENQKALHQTMDSIRPGSIEEQQKLRRNLYFNKLSKQLEELQGEAPPPPVPQAQQLPPGVNPQQPILSAPTPSPLQFTPPDPARAAADSAFEDSGEVEDFQDIAADENEEAFPDQEDEIDEVLDVLEEEAVFQEATR